MKVEAGAGLENFVIDNESIATKWALGSSCVRLLDHLYRFKQSASSPQTRERRTQQFFQVSRIETARKHLCVRESDHSATVFVLWQNIADWQNDNLCFISREVFIFATNLRERLSSVRSFPCMKESVSSPLLKMAFTICRYSAVCHLRLVHLQTVCGTKRRWEPISFRCRETFRLCVYVTRGSVQFRTQRCTWRTQRDRLQGKCSSTLICLSGTDTRTPLPACGGSKTYHCSFTHQRTQTYCLPSQDPKWKFNLFVQLSQCSIVWPTEIWSTENEAPDLQWHFQKTPKVQTFHKWV